MLAENDENCTFFGEIVNECVWQWAENEQTNAKSDETGKKVMEKVTTIISENKLWRIWAEIMCC